MNPDVTWFVGQTITDRKLGNIEITDILKDADAYLVTGQTVIRVYAKVNGENVVFREYLGNLPIQLTPKI